MESSTAPQREFTTNRLVKWIVRSLFVFGLAFFCVLSVPVSTKPHRSLAATLLVSLGMAHIDWHRLGSDLDL